MTWRRLKSKSFFIITDAKGDFKNGFIVHGQRQRLVRSVEQQPTGDKQPWYKNPRTYLIGGGTVGTVGVLGVGGFAFYKWLSSPGNASMAITSNGTMVDDMLQNATSAVTDFEVTQSSTESDGKSRLVFVPILIVVIIVAVLALLYALWRNFMQNKETSAAANNKDTGKGDASSTSVSSNSSGASGTSQDKANDPMHIDMSKVEYQIEF